MVGSVVQGHSSQPRDNRQHTGKQARVQWSSRCGGSREGASCGSESDQVSSEEVLSLELRHFSKHEFSSPPHAAVQPIGCTTTCQRAGSPTCQAKSGRCTRYVG